MLTFCRALGFTKPLISATHRYTLRMASTRALVCRPSNGKNHLSLESVSLPSPQPHQVLVRTKAVAQNPTDVKSFDDNSMGDGAVLGCDICGRVEQLGADVTRVKTGDRVGAFVFPGEQKGVGAYAEHTLVDEKICFKVPESMLSEAAATISLALATAWLALFSSYSLGMDRTKGDTNQMLIWGGSSSVGQYAIQLAEYFKFRYVTTCTNAELVRSLGATSVFNYRSPTVAEDIKKRLPGITYVLDCIGTEASSAQASKTVCDAGGVLCTVRPGKAFTENIEPRVRATDVLVYTAFFKEISYRGLRYAARQEDRELAIELFEKLPEMLQSGAIKPNPVRVIDGGLNGVAQGFQLHRDKAISGQKLVYSLGP